MPNINPENIGIHLLEYCEKFNIPPENIIEILEDQKVLPMIRGKATEYVATNVLSDILPSRLWQVQKLNLNAQPNQYDEDISVTYNRTGDRLKVESKNAVRGSFRLGTNRTAISEPHFKVKLHKSRSHLKKSSTTNDRYLLGEFDLVVCNVSNAIFQGATIGENLELLHNESAINFLKDFYNVSSDDALVKASYNHWVGCFPRNIAEADGSIPRTPAVKLVDDPNWFNLDDLENTLLDELTLIRKTKP